MRDEVKKHPLMLYNHASVFVCVVIFFVLVLVESTCEKSEEMNKTKTKRNSVNAALILRLNETVILKSKKKKTTNIRNRNIRNNIFEGIYYANVDN